MFFLLQIYISIRVRAYINIFDTLIPFSAVYFIDLAYLSVWPICDVPDVLFLVIAFKVSIKA